MKVKPLFLLTLLCVSALFIACDNDEAESRLTFDKNSVTLNVDETDTVKVSGGVTPYKAEEANDSIVEATVSSAAIIVKGLKIGNTTVKVTDKNGVHATFAVKVEE
ncbi:MAG: Ig-like domain-containing protein [Proteiniphilum sp.]|jgi:hypothetical protein|nr:Ig-like domain-containing protein [Proteiniphilum sp.]